MYGKAQYELELKALDAADACISAAIVGDAYADRLTPYLGTFHTMSEYFWARDQKTGKKLDDSGIDANSVADMFVTLAMGEKITGRQSLHMTAAIERVRRKLKGKLLGARVMLMDNDAKPKCDSVKTHNQPCKCKAYNKFKANEALEG